MPILQRWLDDAHTTLQVQFTGDWTIADYEIAAAETKHLLNGETHPVDLIINVEKTTMTPDRIFAIGVHVGKTHIANRRLMVIVGLDAVLRAVVAASRRLNPNADLRVEVARSLPDAGRVIAQYRAGLVRSPATASQPTP